MKKLLLPWLWLCAGLLVAVAQSADETYVDFRADLPAGTACRIDARRLHPTRAARGAVFSCFPLLTPIKNLLLPGFWLCAAFLVAAAQPADEPYVDFRAAPPAGTACRIDARRLHPTQFALGLREVAAKT